MTDPFPPASLNTAAGDNPAEPADNHQEAPLAERLTAPSHLLTWIAASALMIALVLWLSFTPNGILGKADAVGYAVCHRITARSFLFPDGRQLPMCARCSGTFIGVLVGLLGPGLIFGRRRAGNFPPTSLMLVMFAFSAFWAFDGFNSFTFLIPRDVPHLYQPNNFLRLFTGMFHGITMGSMILPIANAALWADANADRTLSNFWQYLALVGIGGVLILMVLSEWPIFLYPLGLLSAIGAVSILATVNTVIMATLLKMENRAYRLRDALPLIMFGFAVTISLIGIIDVARFAMFGTWDGFTTF
jgi:uncharacterized membrane protein